MIEEYNKAIASIDDMIVFLTQVGIDAKNNSHLENDYLLAHQFCEEYSKNPQNNDQNEEGRAALAGLYELYKWIWSVKDCDEFHKLNEHLKLLIEACPKINNLTPMLSPITNKQDDKTNKFIEAIIGMYAVKVGRNVNLDDPIKSSNGNNPDVMFDYNEKRIAFACKTLRGNSPKTILDNLRSAAKQIERSSCDLGYILLNSMNVLPHEKINNKIFMNYKQPLDILFLGLDLRYSCLKDYAKEDVSELFFNKKTRPVILTFIHSVTRIASPIGNLLTSLKATHLTDFEINGINTENDIKLLSKVNEFIHNKI